MKTRNGFVSNSSSSSFVVVAPKSSVDNVLETLDSDYERAAVKHVMKEKTFLDQTVCVFQGTNGEYDSWEYDFSALDYFENKNDAFDVLSPSEIFDNFLEKLKKETKDVIVTETDF